MEKMMGMFNTKNIKGSLKTTIVGAVLCLFSMGGMYKVGFDDLAYDSVLVIILLVGLGLLFLNDRTDGASKE